MMHQSTSVFDKISVTTADDKITLSKRPSLGASLSRRASQKPGASALRTSIVGRRLSKTPSKQFPGGDSLLQRRDNLRIYEAGEDVTPRNLTHSQYHCLEDRFTAFDIITQTAGSQVGSSSQLPRSSRLSNQSSLTSVYTLEDFMLPKNYSKSSSLKGSLRAISEKGFGIGPSAVFNDELDAPSQFPLPKFDNHEYSLSEDRIVLTLKETKTLIIFEISQKRELADSKEGRAVTKENERYEGIKNGIGRKTVSAEVQTIQFYTKTRSTYIGRKNRKNSSTYVNNWVMYDNYLEAKRNIKDNSIALVRDSFDTSTDRFKFTRSEKDSSSKLDKESEADKREETVFQLEGYEDATRVTLRILAGRDFKIAQKQFTGMLRQDSCDPDLKLTYDLDLLWTHSNSELLQRRPVTAFQWNPVNNSLLAVGYGSVPKASKRTPGGLLLIWCAKNPGQPDRRFEFSSQISSLDWSKTVPNLLALGFYDGVIRIVDVCKRNLTVIRETQREHTRSFGPYWQVQWWPLEHEPIHPQDFREQLYASNQDGRITCFSATADFIPRELLQVQRLEGKVVGVKRVNHCLGPEVPINRTSGALLVRQHPEQQTVYLVGTEEGCVLRCSISHPDSYLENFFAHDGPIFGLEFSPFHSGLILTCGADWFTRVWAYDLIDEPLLSFNNGMACVNDIAWSPRNSTIFATAVGNEIYVWDLSRKDRRPASVIQVSSQPVRVLLIGFTHSGRQLVAADDDGTVYVYGLNGMPLPEFDPKKTLIDAVYKSLLTKPELLHRLKKIDPLFDF